MNKLLFLMHVFFIIQICYGNSIIISDTIYTNQPDLKFCCETDLSDKSNQTLVLCDSTVTEELQGFCSITLLFDTIEASSDGSLFNLTIGHISVKYIRIMNKNQGIILYSSSTYENDDSELFLFYSKKILQALIKIQCWTTDNRFLFDKNKQYGYRFPLKIVPKL
ncbi:MAG: hypothetical protein EOL95_11675 [Bacteroidia bacterium]|nr:hypothetical protein [Bacteroidia bacterium]